MWSVELLGLGEGLCVGCRAVRTGFRAGSRVQS